MCLSRSRSKSDGRRGAAAGRGRPPRRPAARRRAAASLPPSEPAAAGGTGQRVSSATLQAASLTVPWWRPQSLLRRAGPRHARTRRRRRPAHAGDPLARPFRSLVGVQVVAASGAQDHRAAPDGNRRFRLGAGRVGQRRARDADGDHGGLSRLPERIEIIGTHGVAPVIGGALTRLPRMGSGTKLHRMAAPAAGPASWTSRMTPIAPSSPIFWMRSGPGGTRGLRRGGAGLAAARRRDPRRRRLPAAGRG